jgi:hypothetical protein
LFGVAGAATDAGAGAGAPTAAAAQAPVVSVGAGGTPMPLGLENAILSGNGRIALFTTLAPSVPGVTIRATEIFALDLQTAVKTRLPITYAYNEALWLTISYDGNVIGITTRARLVPGLPDVVCPAGDGPHDCTNAYVYDLSAGVLSLVSVTSEGVPANGSTSISGLSGDGRFVLLSSTATNLAASIDGDTHLFRHDRVTHLTARAGGGNLEMVTDWGIYDPRMSRDGQTIAYRASRKLRTADGQPYSRMHVYVTSLVTGQTRWLDPSPEWGPYTPNMSMLELSADGSTALVAHFWFRSAHAFTWEVHDLVTGQVQTSSVLLPGVDYDRVSDLALSDDGRVLAFFETAPYGGGGTVLRIIDRVTGITETVPSSWGARGPLQLTGNGRFLTFQLSGGPRTFIVDRDPDGDGMSTEWERTFGLNPDDPSDATSDLDGDGLTALQEFQQASNPSGTMTRFFAEGAANDFFSTHVAVVNPNGPPLVVTMRLLGTNGRVTSQTQTIYSMRRGTFELRNVPDSAFSIIVEGSQPFVADRLMTWDKSGYGSSLETAVASPGTSWFFAEGATGGPYSLYYLLQNPGDADAQATVTYLRPTPLPPIVKIYVVPAHSRQTIDVRGEDPGLAAAEVSASIAADRPIVAERAMYFSRPGQPMVAGHAGAGIAAPAPRWFLAEGATGFFDEYVLIANPGMDDAQVTVTYLLEDGTHFAEPITVARQSRFTLDVKARDPRLAATPVSIIVDSTNAVPIVVERVMWWPHGGWYEASLSAGVTTTGPRWLFAEGEQGGASGQQTYVLIANTGDKEVRGMMLVLHEESEIWDSRDLYLKPHSRTSVSLDSFPLAAGKRFGMLITLGSGSGLGDQIVVERSVYSSPGGRLWSAGATAVATDISSWPWP